MQWISVGSGIEHAEGGGTPAGVNTEGFQACVYNAVQRCTFYYFDRTQVSARGGGDLV